MKTKQEGVQGKDSAGLGSGPLFHIPGLRLLVTGPHNCLTLGLKLSLMRQNETIDQLAKDEMAITLAMGKAAAVATAMVCVSAWFMKVLGKVKETPGNKHQAWVRCQPTALPGVTAM